MSAEVVYAARGYHADHGDRVTSGTVATWRRKADADRVARALGDGWEPVRVHTALTRGLWAVHRLPGGGFLHPAGFVALVERRAAEHVTRTYARDHRAQSYNVNSRGMTGYRVTFSTVWACTCGAGGFGEDRDRASAARRARLHREDPSAHPGHPWNAATVAELRSAHALPASIEA